ncbi:MAG: hypothetical protein DMF51_06360 [Acidobacteria bacterium]|nr:MAG: hypothetical protein DMF51_06360 [Acidobacteriota bacterium]
MRPLTGRLARHVHATLVCVAGALNAITASDLLLPGRITPYGLAPREFGVADFDGDGRQDILVGTGDPNSNTLQYGVSLLHGKGDGTFEVRRAGLAQPYTYGPFLVVDINGDRRPDVVSPTSIYPGNGPPLGGISVLLGNGDGTFARGIDTAIGPNSPFFLRSGDFNGDGATDLVALSEGGQVCDYFGCRTILDYIWILLGNGDGTFAPAIRMTSQGPYPVQVAVADLNGDGLDDLAVADHSGFNAPNHTSVSLFLSLGNGTFENIGGVRPDHRPRN